MKNIAVVIGGSGHMDGSEIQETVSTLLALSKFGLRYNCFSIDREQKDLMNHAKGEADDVSNKRNLLVEAARIARGDIQDISLLESDNFDAIIFPGGFGVAKNFFSYAFDGRNAIIDEAIKNIIMDFHNGNKYIGAICISPMLIAKAFEGSGKEVKITLGSDRGPFEDAKYFGANPIMKPATEIVIDKKNKIVTTPAYMEGKSSIFEIYTGIEKLVEFIASV